VVFQIFCDITSTGGTSTLFSEISQAFDTGIAIVEAETGLNLLKTGLNLIKNGDVTSIVIKQMLPMSCPHDHPPESCSFKILIRQTPDGKFV
jgi:hypothetical protein